MSYNQQSCEPLGTNLFELVSQKIKMNRVEGNYSFIIYTHQFFNLTRFNYQVRR